MDELFKALRQFIARDLVLAIAGGSVVATFLDRTGRLPQANDSWVLFALLAGLGYFVGFALQDGFCLTGLSTITAERNPNAFVKWLYERYTHLKWIPITIDLDEARDRITNESVLARLERLVTLKQICTAGGPSFIACAGLLAWRWNRHRLAFDGALAMIAFALSILLFSLGWLKSAQQAEFIARQSKRD